MERLLGCEFMKIFLGFITDNVHAYLLLSMREVVTFVCFPFLESLKDARYIILFMLHSKLVG